MQLYLGALEIHKQCPAPLWRVTGKCHFLASASRVQCHIECRVKGPSGEELTPEPPKAMGKEASEGAFRQAQKKEGLEASSWVQLASLPLCLQK